MIFGMMPHVGGGVVGSLLVRLQAAGLAAVMAGATYTHFFGATGEGGMAAFTLLLAAFTGLLAWARRPASLRERSAGAAHRVAKEEGR